MLIQPRRPKANRETGPGGMAPGVTLRLRTARRAPHKFIFSISDQLFALKREKKTRVVASAARVSRSNKCQALIPARAL